MWEAVKLIAAGMLIGVGAILPGVSGGVLAVSLGLYERAVHAAAHFFRAPGKNLALLLPLGAGVLAGGLLTGRAVEWLLTAYPSQVLTLFIGLVLGGIPALRREAFPKGAPADAGKAEHRERARTGVGRKARTGKEKPKQRPYRAPLLAAAAGFALFIPILLIDAPALAADGSFTLWEGLLCGGVIALGCVVPGVSMSFLMMWLGLYQPFLHALTTFHIRMLLPVAAGCAVVAVLLLRAVSALFAAHRQTSYGAVLGMTLGSVLLVLPRLEPAGSLGLHILLLALGLAGGLLCEKALAKKERGAPRPAPENADRRSGD